jgi:SAM-dependent methyltransferase
MEYNYANLKAEFLQKAILVKKYCPKGRLLDVGCALGFFVEVAKDFGFDAYGIDFSDYAILQAKLRLGDKVSRVNLEKDALHFEKGSFDVITMWDVLEHLKNPEVQIQRMSKLLKKNGFLFITTVNYNSLMARLMRNTWRFKNLIYHPSYFITLKMLRTWVRNAGFAEVNNSTFGLGLKPVPKILRVENPKIKGILDRQYSLVFWALNPLSLGDGMSFVARKL